MPWLETSSVRHPCTTCAFVTMIPSTEMAKPDPEKSVGGGLGLSAGGGDFVESGFTDAGGGGGACGVLSEPSKASAESLGADSDATKVGSSCIAFS